MDCLWVFSISVLSVSIRFYVDMHTYEQSAGFPVEWIPMDHTKYARNIYEELLFGVSRLLKRAQLRLLLLHPRE